MNRQKLLFWMTGANGVYFCLSLYWFITNTGPVPWLVRLQLTYSDNYYSIVTIFLLLLPLWIPFWLLGRKDEQFNPLTLLDRWPLLQDLAFPTITVAVTGGLGIFLWAEAHAGPPTPVTVKEMISTPRTGTRFYADVTGFQYGGNGITTHEDKKGPVHYFPLRSSPTDKGPVYVLVQVDENEQAKVLRSNEADHSLTARGMVDQHIPGEVAVWLEREGLVLAEGCQVIHTHADPARAGPVGIVAVVAGLALAVFFFWQNRRRRQAAN